MFLDDNQKYCWVNFVVLFISVGIGRTLTIIFQRGRDLPLFWENR